MKFFKRRQQDGSEIKDLGSIKKQTKGSLIGGYDRVSWNRNPDV
jgi:hypothetical protein